MDEILTKAIAAAQVRYSGGQWMSIHPAERVAAIYQELRRLDLEHVVSLRSDVSLRSERVGAR